MLNQDKIKRPLADLCAEARAVTRTGPWCGPTTVVRVTGRSYIEVEQAYARCNPKKYKVGKIACTWPTDTYAVLRGFGVELETIYAGILLKADLDGRRPTLTRTLRQLESGWYVVQIPGHVMLVERREGDVYNTKSPCCFIWDNQDSGKPVGSRKGLSRHGGSTVRSMARIKNFPSNATF